jgi:hypothetical protein
MENVKIKKKIKKQEVNHSLLKLPSCIALLEYLHPIELQKLFSLKNKMFSEAVRTINANYSNLAKTLYESFKVITKNKIVKKYKYEDREYGDYHEVDNHEEYKDNKFSLKLFEDEKCFQLKIHSYDYWDESSTRSTNYYMGNYVINGRKIYLFAVVDDYDYFYCGKPGTGGGGKNYLTKINKIFTCKQKRKGIYLNYEGSEYLLDETIEKKDD